MNKLTAKKIARLLSAITEHDTKIDCDFSVDEYGKFASNNIIEQTGVVGQQLFRTIFLKYDIRRFYRYVVFGSFYYYELFNGDCYGYKLKDYIYDTEKEQFLLNDAEKNKPSKKYLMKQELYSALDFICEIKQRADRRAINKLKLPF